MNNQKNTEFLKLYDPIHNQLYRFCRAISGRTEDAEDLLQDTILNVIEGFDNIRNKSVFKTYLFSVASNLNKMKLRRLKFRAEFNENEIRQLVDSSQNQEYLTDFGIIYEKILLLPQKTAETIILFHISDLTLEEIRIIQGGSLSGVKLRLKRGREKILSLLNTPEDIKMALIFLTF